MTDAKEDGVKVDNDEDTSVGDHVPIQQHHRHSREMMASTHSGDPSSIVVLYTVKTPTEAT